MKKSLLFILCYNLSCDKDKDVTSSLLDTMLKCEGYFNDVCSHWIYLLNMDFFGSFGTVMEAIILFISVFLMMFLVMDSLVSACIMYLIAQEEDGDITSPLSDFI